MKRSFSDLNTGSPFPLEGKSILDVGCGGGILSEVSGGTFNGSTSTDVSDTTCISPLWCVAKLC